MVTIEVALGEKTRKIREVGLNGGGGEGRKRKKTQRRNRKKNAGAILRNSYDILPDVTIVNKYQDAKRADNHSSGAMRKSGMQRNTICATQWTQRNNTQSTTTQRTTTQRTTNATIRIYCPR